MHRLQISRALAALVLVSLAVACGGGGGGNPPGSPVTPTPLPTSTSTATGMTSGTAFTCPTSASTSAIARSPLDRSIPQRRVMRTGDGAAATGLIAVTYGHVLDERSRSLALVREHGARASFVNEVTFAYIGRTTRVLSVAPGTEAAALAALRSQADVVSASPTGSRRMLQAVAQKYYPNDPYFNGFTAAQLVAAGNPAAATYHVDPFEENASVEGQWDMHAVRIDYAQAYAQANNGSGIVNGGAAGSAGVKVAVIDTGSDPHHPELATKIAYQKCFLTSSASPATQSTSTFVTDRDGHGTNVASLAAGSTNNGLGFTSAGGNASIYDYRAFPTPDDNCTAGNAKSANDPQCGASVADIATAINDAVNQKVNVINLSFGGGTCTNGIDPDNLEQIAVANALAANIVVVAAAGNAASASVNAPACISGVIAVGATALSDGRPTGTASAPVGTASAPIEYVAGYSNYGSPSVAPVSPTAWGIVAPGGDPSATADTTQGTVDNLHWIENVNTTTPFDSNFGATQCSPDSYGTNGTPDCRVLIAGTSQATPIVAGAAALIIAANPAYQSPTKMKQLLCTTAHDIGDAHEGCGRLDVYRAMATAVGDPALPASR